MKFMHGAGWVLIAAAFALAGCSAGGGQAAPDAAAASQWLAVARGKVDVEGGLVLVAARTDGVVTAINAKQGDSVKQGAVLATLDARAAKIAVATAKAGVAEATAQSDELKVALAQAAQRAPRVAAAAKAGAATGEAADQAAAALATLRAKSAAAAAAVDAAQQTLASAQLALEATTVRAPVAGSVVQRHVAVGQSVAAAGQPLFELLPERPRVVHAQLDVDAAGAIHAGMQAQVVRDSGNGPAYTATVLWVGQVLQPASLTQDPLQQALANDVDCTLELAPAKAGEPALPIGQRVLVRFPRKTR